MSDLPTDAPKPASRRGLYVRLGILVALVVTFLLVRAYTDFGARFLTTAEIRTLAQRGGVGGFALYVGVCALGLFLHIPGWVFVGAGVLAWGHLYGALAAYVASFIGVNVSFFLVRAIGGKSLAEISNPWMKKILDRLSERPVATVTLVRTFLMSTPTTNYAFALSPIDWQSHCVGSAMGLIPSVTVMSLFLGIWFR